MKPANCPHADLKSVLPLDAVNQQLVTACESGGEEAVHQLRISIRRALVGLDLCRNLIEPRARRRVRRRLSKTLRLAGEIRDIDVMLYRWANRKAVAKILSKRRKKSFKKLKDICQKKLQNGRYLPAVQDIFHLKEPQSATPDSIDTALLNQFASIAQAFTHDARLKSFKPSELHSLRKSGKRLRYSLDAMKRRTPAFSSNKLQKRLKRLQDRLGELNDHHVALTKLSRMAGKSKRRSRVKKIRSLREDERGQLRAAIDQIKSHWTDEDVKWFEAKLRKLIARHTNGPKQLH